MLTQRCRAASLATCMALLTTGCSLFGQGQQVSVSFPDGWDTTEVAASDYREAKRAAEPDIDQFLGDEVTAITVGWDPDAPSACGVFSGPEREGLEFVYWTASWDLIARTAASIERDPGQEPGWVLSSSDDVMLPSGPAMLIGVEQSGGPSGIQYKVNEDDRSFVLVCYAYETPRDRWLSIAETTRFLPED
jgi:hypothetical protein